MTLWARPGERARAHAWLAAACLVFAVPGCGAPDRPPRRGAQSSAPIASALSLPAAGEWWRSRVFALAGDDAVDLPAGATGAATDHGVDARALLRLADDRVLVAQPRGGYLIVDERGRAARPAGSARWPAHPKDLALAADGAILITDGNALWQADRTGRVRVLAGDPGLRGEVDNPTGVAALADGSVLWSDRRHNRVLRRGADGRSVTVAGSRFVGVVRDDQAPGPSSALERPGALAALGDGSFLVAEGLASMRVSRITADERVTTVAGGGRRDLAERCLRGSLPATATKLSAVTDLVALADGGFLIVDEDAGVFRVSPDGVLRSVLCGAANVPEQPPPGGRLAARAVVGLPQSVALVSDGALLVGYPWMVAMVPGRAGTRRLGVALAASRVQLARAQVVVASTRRAAIMVTLSSASGQVLAVRRRVPAGRTIVRLSAPMAPGLHVLRLGARAGGRTAADHLRVVVPDPHRLNPDMVRDAILRWHEDQGVGYDPHVTCRSVVATTVSCLKRDVLPPEGFVVRERWTVRRGADRRLRAVVQDLEDSGAAPERVILKG
jgi:hypothetical protein